jgi:hypothetical protein
MASDYNESLIKSMSALKGSSAQVSLQKLIRKFWCFGTSLDLASAYGDMGTSMGLTDEAAKMYIFSWSSCVGFI